VVAKTATTKYANNRIDYILAMEILARDFSVKKRDGAGTVSS
jgi:hypothetical protein